MKCDEARIELAAFIPGGTGGVMPDTLGGHLAVCDGCRAWFGRARELEATIADIPDVEGPDAAYWVSIVPRLRDGIESRRKAGRSLPESLVLRFSAACVLLFLLYLMAATPPGRVDLREAVTTLSGNELYDLQQAQKYSGLLSVYENGSAAGDGNSITDLLGELISDEPLAVYYAALDPADVVRSMDESEFSAFVDLLEKKK